MTISAKLKHRRLTISAIFKCRKVTKSSNFEYMPFGWYLPAGGQWLEVLLTLGGRSMSSSNLKINATESFFEYEAVECMTLLNQYLTACPNYDEIVGGNSTGLYWHCNEKNPGVAPYTAFGFEVPISSNYNMHFWASYFGGKSELKKVRAFVTF